MRWKKSLLLSLIGLLGYKNLITEHPADTAHGTEPVGSGLKQSL